MDFTHPLMGSESRLGSYSKQKPLTSHAMHPTFLKPSWILIPPVAFQAHSRTLVYLFQHCTHPACTIPYTGEPIFQFHKAKQVAMKGWLRGLVDCWDHTILVLISVGDYVIVDPIAEGNKVQAEIVNILYPLQIKHLKEEKLW